MILDNIRKELLPNGRARLSASASYASDHGSGREDTFYFEYPAELRDDLVETGDPWLALFLPVSVVLGEPLTIPVPVDPLLLEGCLEVLEIWHCWMPHLPVIPVAAETLSPARTGRGRTGSFFSGGVDSMHTLLRHEDSPSAPRAERIDDLITIFGIFGREDDLVRKGRGRPMRRRMDAIAAHHGKQIIEVHTNAHQTAFDRTNSLKHSHGYLLAAAALAMGGRYTRVLVPGSITYADTSPGGSHPLTDRLLSTTATRMVPDACDVVRFQKVEYLAHHDHDLASLQVCSRDLDLMNCSACYKCIRAMLILEVLGKLGECELFREPDLEPEKVASLYCSTKPSLVDFQLALREAERRGNAKMAHAIELLIRRSAWLHACRVLIAKLREGSLLSEPDRTLLVGLLGDDPESCCSPETRASLDAVLGYNSPLRAHLVALSNQGETSVSATHVDDRMFLRLEHVLLGGSVCESTLDIELRDADQSLCEPNVIYAEGAPLVIDRTLR